MVEICLAAVGALFPIKLILIIFIGLPLVFYLLSKPLHAYLLIILLLPFWEITLRGIGDIEGQIDIRYTEIAAAIAILSWLFNGLITKKLCFEKNILNLPIAILIGWMTLSLIWAVSIYLGIRELLLILYGVIVFLLTINIVKDEKTLNITIKTWIIACFLCALSGMVELIMATLPVLTNLSLGHTIRWGTIRVSGLKENPHRLGFLLNVGLMIIVPQLISSKSKKYGLFLFFCMLIMLVVIINTMSRSTWIGCFIGIACCSFYSKRLAKIFLVSGLVALVLFVVLAPDALQYAVVERSRGVVNPMQTASIASRENVWNAGMRMFKERPITGVGVGSFSALAKPYGSTYLEAPHDIYLFFLSEFGLIGLSIFITLIFTVTTSIIRGLKCVSNNTNKFVLFGLFIALIIYFTQGLVVSYKFLEMEMWALLGLAVAALKIFTSEKDAANM